MKHMFDVQRTSREIADIYQHSARSSQTCCGLFRFDTDVDRSNPRLRRATSSRHFTCGVRTH